MKTVDYVIWLIGLWVACGVLCAYVGGQKNRDKVSWFLAGLFFGVFATIAVVAVPVLTDEERRERDDVSALEDAPDMEEWRRKTSRSLRDLDKEP